MGVAVRGAARRRRMRIAEWAVLCVALAALVPYAVHHVGLTSHHSGLDQAAAVPSKVFRLRWRPDQLRPARSAGHICVVDAIEGRICAPFRAGERPAVSLTRELERRGLKVQATVVREGG